MHRTTRSSFLCNCRNFLTHIWSAFTRSFPLSLPPHASNGLVGLLQGSYRQVRKPFCRVSWHTRTACPHQATFRSSDSQLVPFSSSVGQSTSTLRLKSEDKHGLLSSGHHGAFLSIFFLLLEKSIHIHDLVGSIRESKSSPYVNADTRSQQKTLAPVMADVAMSSSTHLDAHYHAHGPPLTTSTTKLNPTSSVQTPCSHSLNRLWPLTSAFRTSICSSPSTHTSRTKPFAASSAPSRSRSRNRRGRKEEPRQISIDALISPMSLHHGIGLGRDNDPLDNVQVKHVRGAMINDARFHRLGPLCWGRMVLLWTCLRLPNPSFRGNCQRSNPSRFHTPNLPDLHRLCDTRRERTTLARARMDQSTSIEENESAHPTSCRTQPSYPRPRRI